ncbi:MAG: metallophosphoesterase family protein [Bacteroidetes bacterium]|nr:metallophosphoesterase family protein [Bacteroidota bacterium]
MKRIGILSDTHGFLHPAAAGFFAGCDEIWHAGDIGSEDIIMRLRQIKPLRAVYGNIDDHHVRMHLPEIQVFEIEGLKVVMLHIAGRPGKYSAKASQAVKAHKPGLLVAGHSHILQVKYDEKAGLLFINPGAAGIQGFHQKITMVRLSVAHSMVKDLEIWESDRSSALANAVD